jgi:hypothetical protein
MHYQKPDWDSAIDRLEKVGLTVRHDPDRCRLFGGTSIVHTSFNIDGWLNPFSIQYDNDELIKVKVVHFQIILDQHFSSFDDAVSFVCMAFTDATRFGDDTFTVDQAILRLQDCNLIADYIENPTNRNLDKIQVYLEQKGQENHFTVIKKGRCYIVLLWQLMKVKLTFCTCDFSAVISYMCSNVAQLGKG